MLVFGGSTMPGVKASFLSGLLATFLMGGAFIKGVQAGPVTFLNDYEGFLAAAGDVRVIDFETLPDGSPSHVGVPITPEFNYTNQGVTFSAPAGDLYISGNPVSAFGLLADGYPDKRTWIVSTLDPPALAVGFFGPGAEFLSVYDVSGSLLTFAVVPDNLADWFVGFVSDVPIASAVADLRGTHAEIQSFSFTPVPESPTLVFVLLAAVAAVRRRSPLEN
jgi:hypothetical protein